MEFVELVNERMATYEAERKQMALAKELRQLGISTGSFSPLAHLDGLLLRASKGAAARQKRREYQSNNRGMAS